MSSVAVFKPENGGDIYVTVLETNISTRFTLDPAEDNVPLWSPDGTRIAFVSKRNGVFDIYEKNAVGTGPEEVLLETPNDKLLNDWSPNGQYLLYQESDPETKKTDVWMLSLADRKASPLLDNPAFNESEATFSPNGRWIAYTSDEDGSRQVYVQEFPTSNGKQRVSTGDTAGTPRWGLNGNELFFDITGTMMAASFTGRSGGQFKTGAARRLFNGLAALRPHNFDVANGRFLVPMTPGVVTGDAAPITVVVNWKSGLSLGR